MTTYATGNPVPSTAVKDLYDNAENLDSAVNGSAPSWTDRLGQIRRSFAGMEQDIENAIINTGYVYTVPLDYAPGIVITLPNQIFKKDGEYYKIAPGVPLPYTTTGVWASEQTNFRSVGDATLRSDLAAPNGVQNVSGAQTTVSSVAALKALAVDKASKWATVQNDKFVSFYRYDGASAATADDATVVAPTTGSGRWLINHDGSMNLYQWGAIGDRVVNDTSAVQKAITWADAGSFQLIVPSCLGFRLTAPIVSNGSPRLRGEHIKISKTVMSLGVNETGNGAWFFLDHLGKGFVFNDGGLVVQRPRLDCIGTYRNQPVPVTGTPYVPLAADFDFYFFNCDSVVRDLVTWNPTKGILISCNPTTSQSRGDISGWFGHPLSIGLQVDFIADVLRIDNLHFWPYFSSNPEVIEYVVTNGIGMLLKRCDNPFITRYFTYGYRFSLGTENYSTYGSVSKLKMVEFDFDYFGQSAIFINGTGGSYAFSVGSGQGRNTTTTDNFFELSAGSSGNNVAVDQIDAGFCGAGVFRCGGTSNNVLRLGSNIRCYNWNGKNLAFPAVGCTPNNIVTMDAMPEFALPLNSGPSLDNNGSIRAHAPLPQQVVSTDANGLATVSSGVGRTPKHVNISVINTSTGITAQETGIDGQIKLFTMPSGAPMASTAVNLTGMMIFE